MRKNIRSLIRVTDNIRGNIMMKKISAYFSILSGGTLICLGIFVFFVEFFTPTDLPSIHSEDWRGIAVVFVIIGGGINFLKSGLKKIKLMTKEA